MLMAMGAGGNWQLRLKGQCFTGHKTKCVFWNFSLIETLDGDCLGSGVDWRSYGSWTEWYSWLLATRGKRSGVAKTTFMNCLLEGMGQVGLGLSFTEDRRETERLKAIS